MKYQLLHRSRADVVIEVSGLGSLALTRPLSCLGFWRIHLSSCVNGRKAIACRIFDGSTWLLALIDGGYSDSELTFDVNC